MKRTTTVILSFLVLFLICSYETKATTFDLSPYTDTADNLLGLAVNPENGNIFLTSLSYSGIDNLWEFTSDGILVNSTRVNVDLGQSGNLSKMVVGKNGNLFISVYEYYGPGDFRNNETITEMSQDGSNVITSFQTKAGSLTYNPINDSLLYAKDDSIIEISIDGALINSFDGFISDLHNYYDFENLAYVTDIAYDPFADSILAIYNMPAAFTNIMLEFERDTSGDFALYGAYDLSVMGMTTHLMAFDINRANGLFYISENNTRVVEFSRSDLISYEYTSPVPEPATMLLLGTGLAGLAGTSLRRKKK